MSFSASSILILLYSFLYVHFCHSLPVTHITEKAKPNPTNAVQPSYLPPEILESRQKNDMIRKSILSREQSKYFTGSREASDGSTEENNQAEMKYKSIKRWRKLIVVVSETNAKSKMVSSHGGHKKKKSRGIDIDYDPPKTHPPSHN